MIAVTRNLVKILQVYRVFLAAVGLTWIAVAYGVFRYLDVAHIGPQTLQNFSEMYLLGFVSYLMYASFYGVYGVSRQIAEFSRVGTVIIKLHTETFLAVIFNVGLSAVIMDRLIDLYGLKLHSVVLILLLVAASSFTRHPFLRRFVNYVKDRMLPKGYESTYPLDDK